MCILGSFSNLNVKTTKDSLSIFSSIIYLSIHLLRRHIPRKFLKLGMYEVVAETYSDSREGEALFLWVIFCFDVRLVVQVIRHGAAEQDDDQGNCQHECNQPHVLTGAFRKKFILLSMNFSFQYTKILGFMSRGHSRGATISLCPPKYGDIKMRQKFNQNKSVLVCPSKENPRIKL